MMFSVDLRLLYGMYHLAVNFSVLPGALQRMLQIGTTLS